MTKSCILSATQAATLALTGRWPGMLQRAYDTVAMQNVSDEEAKQIDVFFLKRNTPPLTWVEEDKKEVQGAPQEPISEPPLEPTPQASADDSTDSLDASS